MVTMEIVNIRPRHYRYHTARGRSKQTHDILQTSYVSKNGSACHELAEILEGKLNNPLCVDQSVLFWYSVPDHNLNMTLTYLI